MAEHDSSRRDFLKATSATIVGTALGAGLDGRAAAAGEVDTSKILNYNPAMEYRRCGSTGLMVSAVCLGGHWKRINQIIGGKHMGGWSGDIGRDSFEKNRRKVVTRCIQRGMNYIDACTIDEVRAYSKALKGRRDQMYLGASWYQKEMRRKEYRKADKLKETMDWGLKDADLEYVDLWRITLLEQSGQHTDAEMDECVEALNWAKKTGRARFIGFSSHDRPHIKRMIRRYPELDVIVTPYTAKSKVVTDKHGLWAALEKNDVGWFGIKPFASNSVFKGNSSPENPHFEEDNRIARLAIRYILCNEAITAPIPGLISEQQVDNVALAVKERRELDAKEKAELKEAMDKAWAELPEHYQWLKDWEYV